MENSTLIAIVAAIVILMLLFNQAARMIVIVAAVLFLLAAAGRAIMRNETCPPGGRCMVDMPAWAGSCVPASGGAIARGADGHYYLTAVGGGEAHARCIDWRVWR